MWSKKQHWYNFQLSILVHIVYTINPNYDILDPKSSHLKIEYLYYISNDRKHDNLFV
jgi:hypothetical protein